MLTSTLIFIILSSSAVSAQSYNDEGVSSYCKKSSLNPYWYVPTPIECCNDNGKCIHWIDPKKTKFGLTNPDPKWTRRSCKCDEQLYYCVTSGLSEHDKAWARYGFGLEICFRKKPFRIDHKNGVVRVDYEFVPLLDIIDRPGVHI